jgi:hypothetical protein
MSAGDLVPSLVREWRRVREVTPADRNHRKWLTSVAFWSVLSANASAMAGEQEGCRQTAA